MYDYRREISVYIKNALPEETDLSAEKISELIELPPKPELGDFAFPCFKLASLLKKAPKLIAEELKDKILKSELHKHISEICVKGAYLNFSLEREVFCSELINSVIEASGTFCSSNEGEGKTVLVEYSSPNIAKPFHVGHAFTTFLGEALKRIYSFSGYKTLALNHLGDYGTQFGKLICAYKRWVDDKKLAENPIEELTRIYVKFHEEAKLNPELESEAREHFRKLEDGAEEETKLWRYFRELSLKEFKRIYERLEIKFDSYDGESFYSDKIGGIVEILKNKGLLKKSEGAFVVDFEDESMPPCIILKSDGTSIYASRDIAAVKYRWDKWKFYKNIYVVGLPQSLHFKQVFKVCALAGIGGAESCAHVGFGTVKFKDRKMSTRSGDIIRLEEILDEAAAKTAKIIRENGEKRGEQFSPEETAEIAERVGVAAVQFAFLKNGRERDIVFDWDEMLDFEGETAPYLLYTYARARSVLRKSGRIDKFDRKSELDGGEKEALVLLTEEPEFLLAKELSKVPEAVIEAAHAYEPFILSRALISSAKAFNKFYSAQKILAAEDDKLKDARLLLCHSLCLVLKEGLTMLGIRTVEKM